MNYLIIKNRISFFLILLVLGSNLVSAQTSEFTYQGKLTDSAGTFASYDFEFRLFDVATGGTALGTIQRPGVQVSGGVFTVKLDFGGSSTFRGSERWLEIAVKPAGSANPLTILTPRQTVTSAPYSIRSSNAATADIATNSTQLGGVAANQFVQTGDARLTDARNPLPGSGNYVWNSTTQQTADFNVSGSGTIGGALSANAITSVTQFNIGIHHAFSIGGLTNVFAGRLAGVSNTTGGSNSFFGERAGRFNTTSGNNSFFGKSAGEVNTASNNSFFGSLAGNSNTTGTQNSFFGVSVGDANVAGDDNAFFGYRAGRNHTASGSSFFGSGAGELSTGGLNSFFGFKAGELNTTGFLNVFVGASAGNTNTTGSFNTIIGWNADTTASNLQFATAIGAGATVSENNTLVLGRSSDKVKMSVLQITGGSDLAENFEIAGEVRPGIIVAIDPENAGKLIPARGSYNRRVAGVVSGANNLAAGMILSNLQGAENSFPVALSGRVWVYADATQNVIKPGDLLTTSATPGHAMKVTKYRRAQGAIIGKAMTELKSGKGLVLVLVSMQ